MNEQITALEGLNQERLKAYKGSEISRKRERQKKWGEKFKVIFSDVDNTLYRKDKHSQAWQLHEDATKHDTPIVAVTGNDFKIMKARIESGELPYYDVIAGEVGTDIWALHIDEQGNKEYVRDVEYEHYLRDVGFDRPEIAKKVNAVIADQSSKNSELKLDYQDNIKESELAYLIDQTTKVLNFKIGAFFYASSDGQIKSIRDAMEQAMPNVKIVICEELGYNERNPTVLYKKYCLDVLPVTKAGAVNYLCDLLGVESGVVCGDSGNDSDMLINSKSFLHAIAVGGRKKELTQDIEKVKDSVKSAGSRNRFMWIKNERGESKRVYFIQPTQNPDELGPDSIIMASNMLLLAEHRGYRRLYATSN